MKQYFTLATCCIIYMSSCIAPVNTSFERAATLGRNNVELTGSYSRYVSTGGGESETIHHNFGVRAGIGISDKADIKVRYERIQPLQLEDGEKSRVNYFSLVPKFTLAPRKFAFLLPISTYQFKTTYGTESETGSRFNIAPMFIGTLTSTKTFDLSLGAKGDYTFAKGEDESDFFMGLTLGAGISQNIDKWAIRPEVGYLFKPGDMGGAWSFGIGAQFILPSKTSR